MPKAHLLFSKHKNSYSVYVENLERLSVTEIQALEFFVSTRNGIFDFNTYTFVIQKKLEFNEFISLIKHIGIDAECEEILIEEKEKTRVGFGQFKGMHYSDIPDSYLMWLKSNYKGMEKEYIDAEIEKRKL